MAPRPQRQWCALRIKRNLRPAGATQVTRRDHQQFAHGQVVVARQCADEQHQSRDEFNPTAVVSNQPVAGEANADHYDNRLMAANANPADLAVGVAERE